MRRDSNPGGHYRHTKPDKRQDEMQTTPSMTRQHFQYIADALKDMEADWATCSFMASRLAATNPRFNRARFMEACAPKVEEAAWAAKA
jgi:hypothetical protein